MLERGDSWFRIRQIFVGKAEVVPGVRIFRELLRGGDKRVASGFRFLLIEERDAQIEPRHRKFWIGLQSLLKKFLRVGGALLIEVGDAESVQAQRLGRFVGVSSRSFWHLVLRSGMQRQKHRGNDKQAGSDGKNQATKSAHVNVWSGWVLGAAIKCSTLCFAS